MTNIRMCVHCKIIIDCDILHIEEDPVKSLGSTTYWYLHPCKSSFKKEVEKALCSCQAFGQQHNVHSCGTVLLSRLRCQMVYSLKSIHFPTTVGEDHLMR